MVAATGEGGGSSRHRYPRVCIYIGSRGHIYICVTIRSNIVSLMFCSADPCKVTVHGALTSARRLEPRGVLRSMAPFCLGVQRLQGLQGGGGRWIAGRCFHSIVLHRIVSYCHPVTKGGHGHCNALSHAQNVYLYYNPQAYNPHKRTHTNLRVPFTPFLFSALRVALTAIDLILTRSGLVWCGGPSPSACRNVKCRPTAPPLTWNFHPTNRRFTTFDNI